MKRRTISNPYAKKQKVSSNVQGTPRSSHVSSTTKSRITSQDNTPRSTNTAQQQANHSHGLTAVDIGASSSFSQAFASVEDTDHYKNAPQVELSSITSPGSNNNNQQDEQDRAAQRALDLQEKQNQPKATISDRDHHILLQPHVLYVSTKQRGNGVLKYIRNVPFAYSKMVPDYIMSMTRCALFLSIKYHQLYPNYIHRRLSELRTDFTLRILLVLVDVEDNANALLYLNRLAVTHELTLVLAWTEQEAARYLETYKALDGKDASSIQKREQNNFVDQVADFVTAAKPTNKTDAGQLLTHFGTVRAVLAASPDELALCPGLGQVKVQRLWDAFHKPFSKHAAAAKQKKKEQEKKEKETQLQQETAEKHAAQGDKEDTEERDET